MRESGHAFERWHATALRWETAFVVDLLSDEDMASITRADRTHTLDAEIQYHGSNGWRLRSKTASEAHLVKGEPVSHFLHLFFAIATLGLWLLVWIPLIVFGGERHKYVSVDEHGRVTSTRPARTPREPGPAEAAPENAGGAR